jgi:transcriptional regulator with XRE-family HTH domain
MGTLGEYLRTAREAKDIDIRDAAQQTRISINYLKALEDEDFAKLPGEVFVRGFLKNYARFLNLDQNEALKRYAELTSKPAAPPVAGEGEVRETEKKLFPQEVPERSETPIEPFIWGAAIFLALIALLFTALPKGHLIKSDPAERSGLPVVPSVPLDSSVTLSAGQEKLYLEIIALEDTWLLVRTDTSPQKKAVLKKGESLIWSADERFLLSYGRIGDVKLLLNGQEVAVQGDRETPIRDLAVTRTGILNQPPPVRQAKPATPRPKPQPAAAQVQMAPQSPAEPASAVPQQQPAAQQPAAAAPQQQPAVQQPAAAAPAPDQAPAPAQ